MLLIATANPHKVEEIRDILADIPVQDLSAFPGLPEPEETGASFEENALLKARYYHRHTGMPVVADDSGLEVDALDGRPGVLSHRYAGVGTPHSFKIQTLLGELADVPDALRTARFKCVAALIDVSGREAISRGVVEGVIAHEPRGSGGFGYDPVFFMPEIGKTMAELSAEEKHSLSHRGRALAGLMQRMRGVDGSGGA